MTEVEFALTEEDWLAWIKDANRRLAALGHGAAANRKGMIFCALFVVIFATVLLNNLRRGFATSEVALAVGIGIFLTFTWLAWKGMRQFSPETQLAALKAASTADGMEMNSARRVAIDHIGIRETSATHERWVAWSRVHDVGVHDSRLLVYTTLSSRQLVAIIIPQSAFGSQRDFEDFCAHAKQFWQAARLGETSDDTTAS